MNRQKIKKIDRRIGIEKKNRIRIEVLKLGRQLKIKKKDKKYRIKKEVLMIERKKDRN